jgi:acetyltransferase-like isoleucine patch superfamily enzyme
VAGRAPDPFGASPRDMTARMDTRAELGDDCRIDPDSIVGLMVEGAEQPAILGAGAIIRAGSIIYGDVRAGRRFRTGHHVLIRGHTVLGDEVTVGTNSVIDGEVEIGSQVKIETAVYIPTHVRIGCRVFLGPRATLTNDRYPLRQRARYTPEGPILEDDVTIGAGAILLPGVRIGRGSLVGAGAVVTRDVPPWSLVVGNPGQVSALPERLREENKALRW